MWGYVKGTEFLQGLGQARWHMRDSGNGSVFLRENGALAWQ